jgi:hypothetical protein
LEKSRSTLRNDQSALLLDKEEYPDFSRGEVVETVTEWSMTGQKTQRDHPVPINIGSPLLIEEGSHEKTIYQLSSFSRRSTPDLSGGRWF